RPNIQYPRGIVIFGNPVILSWKVKGCYKITINHCANYPGHIKSVTIDAKQLSTPVTVTYYGVKEKTEQVVHLNLIKLNQVHQVFNYHNITLPLNTPFNLNLKNRHARLKYINRFKVLTPDLSALSFFHQHIQLKQISTPKIKLPNYSLQLTSL
ncbi:MAG: hypothetical protein IT236_18315, partial [Bacteroidia bacterium]|nr:hypothetical protein [Bacteroidia bacterium]